MTLFELLVPVEEYVRELYRAKVPSWRTFHNFHHTSEVVRHSRQLANHYGLNESESFALLAASWFHDTGFSLGNKDHEKNSSEIAKAFLVPYHIDKVTLASIRDIIMATKLPANPKTISQQILCDCDLQHLSSSDYEKWSEALRFEFEHQNGERFSDERWNEENIAFLSSHEYFTEYARQNWNHLKNINLLKIQSVL